MARIDLLETAVCTGVWGMAGFAYGLAQDLSTKGIPMEGFPRIASIAAKACTISYLAFTLFKAAILMASDMHLLEARRIRIAEVAGVVAWGTASIIAFRQLNLIAGLGTSILSIFLALQVTEMIY